MIRAFIQHLAEQKLINLNAIDHPDDEGFDSRFKVQKYAYLAKLFGLDHPYTYSMYRHGPYSPNLAQAYYDLARRPEHDESLPGSFDKERFADIVKGKDNKWLEVATTLLDLKPDSSKSELLGRAANAKRQYDPKYIERVLDDLVVFEIDSVKNLK